MSNVTEGHCINGVNVEELSRTVKAVRENADLGAFQFRAHNRWLDGGRNRSTIGAFYGAGTEDASRTRPFVLDCDEPQVLLGKDAAANPVEYVLHALAACLTTSLVYHAAARGIHVESVESDVSGEIDIRGFLGLSDVVPRGYQSIRVRLYVRSDAPAEKLKELAAYSPVFNTIVKPTPVETEVLKLPDDGDGAHRKEKQ